MHRIGSLIIAGLWAVSLTAQTEPNDQTMRDFMKNIGQYGQVSLTLDQLARLIRPAETKRCAVPLRQIPIPKNLEPMPVLRPRTDLFDNMPVATPMPPCEEQTH